ncbi:acylphosphatase [soil metagenome]
MEYSATRAKIRGTVQGVGYRWATRREAERLGLTGSVRNLADGSVEVVVNETDDASAALLSWLNDGPPGAVVHSVELESTTPTGGASFEIVG